MEYRTEIYFLTVLETGSPRSRFGGLFSEASLLGLYTAAFSLCLHMVFPLCMSVSESPLLYQSFGLEPNLVTHCTLITSLKTISKYSHILRYWGFEEGGAQFSP